MEDHPLSPSPKRHPHARFFLLMAIAASLLPVALGCAGRLSGVVDFDSDVDFDQKRTLAFYEDAFPLERKQTDTRQLIRAAIEQQLRTRGYGFGRAGEADLLIVYHVGNRAKMHFGGTMTSTEREASLSIAFQDPVTRRDVWYGTIGQTWTGEDDVAERVDTAVAKLLEQFPPEGDGGETRVHE